MKTKPTGLYLHIPFCLRKCKYCDFCSYSSADFSEKDLYINALCNEIKSYSGYGISIDTVFFGGGTPSLLSPLEFSRINEAICATFTLTEDVEFTIESNPKTLTAEKLLVYKECGVNRVSIGLQSMHDDELAALGRIHNFCDFLHSYELVRAAGINNVNIDLMYGIPRQTIKSFEKTLDTVLSLSPEHLSVYGLMVEEGTPLAKSPELQNLPSEDDECDMYYMAHKRLETRGYSHYEISNYAKEGFECRHNLKYWHNESYIGVGVSAHSYFGGVRYENRADKELYVSDFNTARKIYETPDIDSIAYDYVMLSLRLSEGFSLEDYKFRFGTDFMLGREKILEKFSDAGYLTVLEGRIRLTERGFYVSNAILTQLI